MSKRGLPRDLKLQKDIHYVEALIEKSGHPVIRMIPVDRIEPNPWQPRKDFGDINELAASIREHGLLEPILVRPRGDRFQIVAGERRFLASRKAGLQEIPCIELDADDTEMLEIALIENLQRKDLDPFEEADAYHRLIEEFGHTHAELAQILGKSRSTITEILSLTAIPEEIRTFCREKGILARKDLLTVARQPDAMAMRLCAEELARGRQATPQQAARPAQKDKREAPQRKNSYVYRDPFGRYEIRIRFYRGEPDAESIRQALSEMLSAFEDLDAP